MAKVDDIENAKISYDYSKIPNIMAQRNYILISENESQSILGRSIHNEMIGSHTSHDKESKNAILVRHIASLGFHCRVGVSKDTKHLEIWRKNLLLHKNIDWSIFEWGTTIPISKHKLVDSIIGKHIERGTSIAIKLEIENALYNAKLTNVDRQVKSDTYQIRYETNNDLKTILKEFYPNVYDVIKAARQTAKNNGSKKPHIVVSDENYIELLVTSDPTVFRIILKSEDFYEFDSTQIINEIMVKDFLNRKSQGLTDEEIYLRRKKRLENYKAQGKGKKEHTSTVNSSNPILKEDIKQLYSYTCQVCGTQIKYKGWTPGLSKKEEYAFLTADAHHIVPLSDNGQDNPSNIICVCPNCHRKLHSGELEISFTKKGPKCFNTITKEQLELKIDVSHSLKFRYDK